MLAALPTHLSPGLNHFVPLFFSLFSVTSANSALRSPRSPIAESHPVAQQPNHFPLFTHPVNIEHAQMPANPSPSIVYFTTSVCPGGWGLRALSRSPLSLHAMSHACSRPVHNSFKRNTYKKTGATLRLPCIAPPRYSLLTTHYSLSPPFGYTIPFRQTL
jgi:hypothetical protein